MAKLIDTKLEMSAIFTVLDCPSESAKTRLLAVLDSAHFGYEPTHELYKAVRKAIKDGQKGRTHESGLAIPSSRALRHMPGLSEEAKNLLREGKKPLKHRSDIDTLYGGLEFYRKLRAVHDTNKTILTELSKDPSRIDMDKVKASVIEAVEDLQDPNQKRAIIALDSEEGRALYKQVFKSKRLYGTGFQNFDSKAGGYQRGDLVLLAANTGGGKSIMAQNLLINAYLKYNLTVAHVTLELTDSQMLGRLLSNISGVEYDHIRQPRHLSRKEKKRIDKAYEEFLKHGERNKCKYHILYPGSVSAVDLMLMLKPYDLDCAAVDNINDMEHTDGDADWSRLGNSAVDLKEGAITNGTLVYACTHITEDNRIAYSKMIKEKADGAWMWTYGEEEKAAGTVKINQPKARHFEAFSFYLTPEFKTQTFLDSAGPPVLAETEDKRLLEAMAEVP